MIKRQLLKMIQTSAISALVFSSFSLNTHAGAMCSACAVPYTWDGVYAGLQAGYSWNSVGWTFDNANFFNIDGDVVLSGNHKLTADGFTGGGTVGYNYQNDDWVMGLEGEILGTQAHRTVISPFFPITDRIHTSSRWLTAIKARAGHAHQDWLAYFSGGWAGGHISLQFQDSVDNVGASSNRWVNGWVIGGGVEYRLDENISFGLSYEYVRLLSNNLVLRCIGCNNTFAPENPIVKAHLNKQIIAARLNYYMDEIYY